MGYYRGGKRGKEIDVVVEYSNSKNILIEVKYREGAPIPDDSAIVELSGEAAASIVVTKTADDFGVQQYEKWNRFDPYPGLVRSFICLVMQKSTATADME